MSLKTATLIVAVLTAVGALAGLTNFALAIVENWSAYQNEAFLLFNWVLQILAQAGLALFMFILYRKQRIVESA